MTRGNLTDAQLDARFRSFLALRAEEIAEQAPAPEIVAGRLADRSAATSGWLAHGWLPRIVGLGVAMVLVLLALFVLGLAGSRPRSIRPLADGPIAFLDGADLLVVGSDGSGLHRLASAQPADPGAHCCSVAFSPDGSRLLIATGTSIDVMNADGSGRHEIARGIALGGATWSPDGTRVAYVAADHGFTQLFVDEADGGVPTRITSQLLFATSPAWSHDGRRIAFGGARSSMSEQGLFVVGADGSGLQQLTSGIPVGSTVAGSPPAWSPDDRSLAFDVDAPAGGGSNIDAVPSNGGAVRPILPAGTDGMAPTWSPDGTWIAFAGWPAGGPMADLYVIRPDGTGRRWLAQDISWVDHPWSPDGTAIAFAHLLAETIGGPSTGYADLRDIRPDGSGEQILAAHEVHGTIAWPPAWP